jgi:hypothetical protein
MTQHRARIAGTATGLALAALVGLPAMAQEDGGLRLTFGLSARVESISNPGLTVPAEPTRERLSSRLSFGLTDTTRTGSVALSAAGTLSADNDDESADGLIDPDFALSLRRIGATSSVELSAFLRESDLDSLRGLVLDPDTGQITEDLLGNGTRRQTGGEIGLSFGDGGPWGIGLSAGLTDTTFSGPTSEVDNRRTNLDGTLRFDLDPATEISAGLSWSRYDEEGDEPRDTVRPELSFRRDRPAGFASANVFAEDTEDGTRAGLSFGRNWELPDSSLAFSLGATRGVTGDLSPTGSLNWQKDLPRGSLRASLRHDVTSGDDDEESIVTTVSLGLTQSISSLSSLNFGLDASDSEDTATDLTTRNASLSATYSHSLPHDWILDAGVTHRIRNEDDSGEATSDTVFLELRRAIEWRP